MSLSSLQVLRLAVYDKERPFPSLSNDLQTTFYISVTTLSAIMLINDGVDEKLGNRVWVIWERNPCAVWIEPGKDPLVSNALNLRDK